MSMRRVQSSPPDWIMTSRRGAGCRDAVNPRSARMHSVEWATL